MSDANFPTDWHLVDTMSGHECRQLSENTYQIRSHTHIITLDTSGFEAYREGSEAFDLWMDVNNPVVTTREYKSESESGTHNA